MSASYLQFVKQYQNRLMLTSKEFNKLDRKYNDINLMKKLQILYPKVSASISPPSNTGFYGIFEVTNLKEVDSIARHMHAYLAYNNVSLTSSQQINSDQSYTFNIDEANRLPLPSSILQLKVTFQTGTDSVDLDTPTGYQIVSTTNNPLDQENTFDCLVDANNYDNGTCLTTFILTSVPNTGWYGNIYMEILSYRTITVSYNYTIYKGSTTASPYLVNAASVSTLGYGTVASSSAHTLELGDRLPNNSSSLLLIINSATPDFRYESITNATYSTISATQYYITPTTTNSTIRVRFAIDSP